MIPLSRTPDFSCFVPIAPKPKGNAKALTFGGRAKVIRVGNQQYEDGVRAFVDALRPQLNLRDQPLALMLSFRMPRPAKVKKSLRETELANKRPDGDKLERAAWDALTQVLFEDDCQIVDWAGSKRVAQPGERAGVHIHLWRV